MKFIPNSVYNLVTTLGIHTKIKYEIYTNFIEYELHTYILYKHYTIIIFQLLYKFETNNSFACHTESSMFLILQN